MPSFLSIPVEIRSKILLHAADTEIRVCHPESCGPTEGYHESRLVGPNLNLLLVCRQLSDEMNSLDLQYRISIFYMCLMDIYTLIGPSRRRKCTLVLSPWQYEATFMGKPEVQQHPSERFEANMRNYQRDMKNLRPGANFTYKTVRWEYTGTRDNYGSETHYYDLIYTF
jgi:hypothetical protein